MKRYLFIFLLSGCSFIDDPHYEVQPELKPFVDQFFIEAESRGFDLDTNLLARIDQIGSGAGKSVGNSIPTIIIDIDFYQDNINLGREYDLKMIEMTVFHELGHALLGLDHTEKNGIMAINTREWHKYASDQVFRQTAIDNLFYKGE